MTDRYPNIHENFSFDAKGVRVTEFRTRAIASDGRSRTWTLRVSGEISEEQRQEIYKNFDDVIKTEAKKHDPNRVMPS